MIEMVDVLIPRELLLDPKLSLKAKALLAIILALGGSYSGEIGKSLARCSADGVRSVSSGMAELIGKGYVVRTEGGKMGCVVPLAERGGGNGDVR